VGTDEVGVGKNALMDSSIQPYNAGAMANLNAQADAIYDDFKHKVAAGRKLPLDKVQEIARGRVWTGADASSRGSSMVSAASGRPRTWQAARQDRRQRTCRVQALSAAEILLRGIQRDLRRKFRERARGGKAG